MSASKFSSQIPHALRLHRPLADDQAGLAIIRAAVVTGRVTPLAQQLCRKYYWRWERRPLTARVANR
jgi:hypothetical protein